MHNYPIQEIREKLITAGAANIDNRQIWHDVDGNFIHAYGGGYLQEGSLGESGCREQLDAYL